MRLTPTQTTLASTLLAALLVSSQSAASDKPSSESTAASLMRAPENCTGEMRLKYLIRTPQGHYLSKYELQANETCDRLLEKGEGPIEVNVNDTPASYLKRIYSINGDLNDTFFTLPRPGKAVSVTYITMRPFNTEKLTLDLAKPGLYFQAKAAEAEKKAERKKTSEAPKGDPKKGEAGATSQPPEPSQKQDH
jgi:hypothetical protein